MTHEVTNQPPPLAGYDVAADQALLTAVTSYGAGWVLPELHQLGELAGSAEVMERARLANVHEPVLRTHDRYGNRIDEVEFHPAWHQLMATAVSHGLHAWPWATTQAGAHVARAAKFYVWTQAEAGHGCPISMTYSVIPALRHTPDLASRFEPLLASTCYEPGLRVPETKQGLLAGMAMTEKQGGSDVRANTTRAVPAEDGGYLLTGHKWFCSAPMCDLFLVLAQTDSGLSCFLLPRVLPDGSRNRMRIQRLKDKLGNRSNASSEVEYDKAVAWPVGESGRGVATIIEMVSSTRLDCILGSAAAIRQACVEATHHASYRRAFGATLASQPAMTSVLADLALESEAATTLAMRLASAADQAAQGVASEAALLRLLLPAAKHWICKRTPVAIAEALECLGGNGYVEESVMPRLYRDAPLNSIWEGSGNVTALDLLRALARSPGGIEALRAELSQVAGEDSRLDQAVQRLSSGLAEISKDPTNGPYQARAMAGLLTVVVQAALLIRHAPAPVADAFCVSRLAGPDDPAWSGMTRGPGGPGVTFGTLPSGLDLGALADRMRPAAVSRPEEPRAANRPAGPEASSRPAGPVVTR
ncbi:MAG: acyl-CoA dehydrogenase family protein [Nocardiopsaceae bacterium]|jgi:putative acyl-CoA dehydrogenase|nr:acyl-CoA dehydrogenase family protein [Nocardiopsaceae bacterium]